MIQFRLLGVLKFTIRLKLPIVINSILNKHSSHYEIIICYKYINLTNSEFVSHRDPCKLVVHTTSEELTI